MSNEETVEISIKSGVYLHNTGNYFVVELGEINGVPGVKTIGHNANDTEVERTFTLEDSGAVVLFCRVISQSEYLGEL